MSRSVNRTGWIGGAAAVVVLLFVGAWFLGVSPQLDKVSAASAERASVEAQNDILRTRIAGLQAQFETLDATKAELAALRVGIPTEPQLAALVQQIDAAATKSGTFVADIVPADPEVVVPVEEAAVADPTAPVAQGSDAAATPAPTPEPTAAATPGTAATPPAGLEGFAGIPVAIHVVGTYESVQGFLREVQTGMSRLMLVTAIEAETQPAKPAQSGMPELAAGDVDATINGYVFVLQDAAAAPADPPAAPAAPTLPSAPAGRNPFLPVAGASVES